MENEHVITGLLRRRQEIADALELPMLAPEQSRAARGWLDWTQEELAKRSNVSLSTVRDFEKERRLSVRNNLLALRHALEQSGIVFNFDGDSPLGLSAPDHGRLRQ